VVQTLRPAFQPARRAEAQRENQQSRLELGLSVIPTGERSGLQTRIAATESVY
jgi:hypothetical protein